MSGEEIARAVIELAQEFCGRAGAIVPLSVETALRDIRHALEHETELGRELYRLRQQKCEELKGVQLDRVGCLVLARSQKDANRPTNTEQLNPHSLPAMSPKLRDMEVAEQAVLSAVCLGRPPDEVRQLMAEVRSARLRWLESLLRRSRVA